jgi:hypothetical protein
MAAPIRLAAPVIIATGNATGPEFVIIKATLYFKSFGGFKAYVLRFLMPIDVF